MRRSRGAALPLVFSWSFRGCAPSLSWEFVPDLNLVLVLVPVLCGAAAPVLNLNLVLVLCGAAAPALNLVLVLVLCGAAAPALNLVLVLVLVLTPPTPPSPPASLPKSAP